MSVKIASALWIQLEAQQHMSWATSSAWNTTMVSLECEESLSMEIYEFMSMECGESAYGIVTSVIGT